MTNLRRENIQQPMEAKESSSSLGQSSILWVSDPKEINRLQHIAVEQTRLHIPVLFGLDVIHGYHTIFPSPIAMASSWDTKMVEEVQAVAAAGVPCAAGNSMDVWADG